MVKSTYRAYNNFSHGSSLGVTPLEPQWYVSVRVHTLDTLRNELGLYLDGSSR